jgi:LacI family transcriptional regulator
LNLSKQRRRTHDGGEDTDRREVALLIETSKTFGRGVLGGIAKFTRTHQAWTILTDERGLDDPLPPWLKQWTGHGIILRTSRGDVLKAARRLKVPAVFLGETLADAMPTLKSDDQAIIEHLTAHLLERGFKRFAYVGLEGKEWSNRRRDFLLKRLAKESLPCELFEFKPRRGRYDALPRQQDRLVRWLRTLTPPVAIAACYDVMGLRVLNACRLAGIAVPEQAAVIGVDDDALLCELANPPLTSVAHDLERIGFEAATLLQKLMRGSPQPRRPIHIPPRGITTRQSTDVLAIDDELVAQAVQLLRRRACEGIQVQDIARQLRCSRVTLNRRFRVIFSRSLKQEILRLQIDRCRQLLHETDFTLRRIAGLAGFRHPEYMSVVFRRETGQTPGQYRRAMTQRA